MNCHYSPYQVDVVTYNNALSACVKSKQWQQSLQLFEDAQWIGALVMGISGAISNQQIVNMFFRKYVYCSSNYMCIVHVYIYMWCLYIYIFVFVHTAY